MSGQGSEGGNEFVSNASSQNEADQGNGSARGSRTNEALGAINALVKRFNLGALPPPAVGGSNGDLLTLEQKSFVCSMQSFAKKQTTAPMAYYTKLSEVIAAQVGMKAEAVLKLLFSKTYCADFIAQRLPTKTTVAVAAPKIIVVDAQGFPVSSNHTFNACFRALNDHYVLTKEDIRNNTSKDKDGTPRDCAYYNANSSGVWYMEDHGGVFVRFDPDTKTLSVPYGYTTVTESKVKVAIK